MFGITINLIKDHYTIEDCDFNGQNRERMEIVSILESNVFSSEDKAIKWLITVISKHCWRAIPLFLHPIPRSQGFGRKIEIVETDASFEEQVIQRINELKLNLENVIEEFYRFWNSEYFLDKFSEFGSHNSKIIKFEVGVD